MTLASSAPNVAALAGDLEAFIETERRRADVVGVAVAAFDREGVRFAGGLGYADLARRERVTPDTLFRAASISKLFTTALVFQEIEAGRLFLDEPVNRYLGPRERILDRRGAPAGDVTLRHLLSHTSGLPVSWRGLEIGPFVFNLVASSGLPPRSLEQIVAAQRTIRRPGRRIVYSNGAFSLMGRLVQHLNRRIYRDLLRERVLEPLGMTRSSFPIDPYGPGIATPYGRALTGGAGRRPVTSIKVFAAPAGGLITSALELARFGRLALCGGELDGERVLPAALLDKAMTLHALNHPNLDDGYGLGFAVSVFRGHRYAGHDGGLPGVSTRLALLPDDGAGAVVLTNGGDPAFVCRVSDHLLDTLLGLSPEAVPGSPAGMSPGSESQWESFARRAQGAYGLVDMFPPGPVSLLFGAMARPRLSHLAEGCLIAESPGFGATTLYPDGAVGRYRVAFPLANGRRAVIEERPDGTHLWVSIMHLFRPRR